MQQPKRFQAPSLGEAYAMVRAELGGDAIILSTRKASSPGLFGQPGRQFVEVIAHSPDGADARRGRRPSFDQDVAAHELVRGVAEAAAMGMAIDPAAELAPPFENPVAGRLRESAPMVTPPAPAFEPMAPTRDSMLDVPFAAPAAAAGPFGALNDPAGLPAAAAALVSAIPAEVPVNAGSSIADRALISTLARQLTEVRAMLDQLVADRVTERVESGPPALKDIHEILVRQGLSQAVVSPLLAQVGEALVRGTDRESALRTVERKLAARMPQPAQLDLGRRPAAVFIVGPSGAGKTTLAIRLGLEIERAHGLRVVVAGTDVNRAGAPQQLVAYGAASGMDVRLCYAPGELKAILEDGKTDLVIVDTPGHNGTRRDRMAELNAFTQAARRRSVLLALPATMKGSDLNDVVAAYSGLGIDGLALTRCDETTTFGALASVAIEASIGIAYTAHSDQVSEAARAGDNLALASAVMSGRWPLPTADRARPAAASAALARVG
jgi:flagellar biosynthesis protein FlhF